MQGSSRAWLLASLFARAGRNMVVVCESLRRAEALRDELRFFSRTIPAHLFPHWDTVPYDGFSPGREEMARRMEALAALATPEDGTAEPVLVVTTPQAWMQGTMPRHLLRALTLRLERGGRYPRQTLIDGLLAAGYVRVDTVEAPGEFCTRGDIVDVFPPQLEHPVRLDFFDDELENLRHFEVDSQTSVSERDSLMILPASEGVLNTETRRHAMARLPHFKPSISPEIYRQVYQYLEGGAPFPGQEQMLGLLYEKVEWLGDWLPPGALCVLEEPTALERVAESFHDEVLGEFDLNLSQQQVAMPPDETFMDARGWRKALEAHTRIPLMGLRMEESPRTLLGPFADNSDLRLPVQPGETGQDGMPATPSLPHAGEVIRRLKVWRDGGARVWVATRSSTAAERLRDLFATEDLGVALREVEGGLERPEDILPTMPGESGSGETAGPVEEIVLLTAAPHHGFRVVDAQGITRFALVTEEEMLGEKTRQRRVRKSKLQHFIASLGELKEGDLVVHVEYGIGRYEGLRRMTMGGEEGDFLLLIYHGGDKVYVPVYKFHQVQKYTGVDAGAPMLNKLGDGAWARSKARASKAIEDMAEDLVRVQAARRTRKGVSYQRGDGLFTEFEEGFPFQETDDQRTAIEEVLSDLESETPMDRLVCGDVGFGKTEVAMRAAFMVVLGGRQVMILVPTTILAQQHFDTFTKRFGNFPVRVEVISRFRSPKEQKQVLAQFASGEVDILIGTHRLLSKDVAPHDLGLLVIDEEQRFGVAHKEKIKALKNLVEVVTLSATPIPRTLHMSLMGVRDLSIINTPPMDRVAVRTRLVRSSDYIITEAVEREVRRSGQVFFVHNKVENIYQFGNYLKSLLPTMRIAVAHGQMPERELEEVMMAFVQGEVDVLLSTSIVESGLDIPRANTIIINNADHFGLSQLYQLRGRVGRSNVQAYAYLLVSPEKVLTDVAQKRLTLLQELNDLGSGFKIASHDLEIRGAGNLLGREQSGHINNIGLELFSQMVEEAVAKVQGEAEEAATQGDIRLDLGFSYLLPEDYIQSTRQRLDIYKQLAEVKEEEELWQLQQAMEDRFGRPPAEMQTLFAMIRIRLKAVGLGLAALERAGSEMQATFAQPERIDLEALLALVNNPATGFRLLPDDRLRLGAFPTNPEGVLERIAMLDGVIGKGKAA